MIRVLFSAVLLFVLSITSMAQEGDAIPDDAFPTVTALQETVIPPADSFDLAMRMRGVDEIDIVAEAPVREVGDQEAFTVSNSGTNQAFSVDATLLAIGDHNYVWAQTNSGIRTATAEEVALNFDEFVYDQVRALWGSEPNPGVDGDPRVHILFAGGLGGGVGAYFARLHTFPTEIFPNSNEREMFIVNLDAFGPNLPVTALQDTLAHEFQHMIRSAVDLNEDTWMDEGLSSFTEFYTGTFPFGTALTFLGVPETQLNTFGLAGTSRGANYGAGALFLTYFYERFGLDAVITMGADPANGLLAVDAFLREQEAMTVDEFFADWVLANIIHDPEAGYGYTALDGVDVRTAQTTLRDVPHTEERELSQYATHYYALDTNMLETSDLDTLDITLSLPETVRLVPTDAFSGDFMWYSNRGDVSDMILTRAFDLSDVEEATLTYKTWYQIEENWDYAYVMVSTDGGATWETLETQNTTTSDPQGYSFGHAYTGSSGGWLEEKIVLDDYAGQEILLRFEQVSDDAVNEPGLVIDDLAIPEIDYFSDFEADGGGWDAAGWIRIDNVLPQQAWLQVVLYKGDNFTVERERIYGEGGITLDDLEGIDRIVIAVSPFAPLTTERTLYMLSID